MDNSSLGRHDLPGRTYLINALHTYICMGRHSHRHRPQFGRERARGIPDDLGQEDVLHEKLP